MTTTTMPAKNKTTPPELSEGFRAAQQRHAERVAARRAGEPIADDDSNGQVPEELLDLNTFSPNRPKIRIRLKGDPCECEHSFEAHQLGVEDVEDGSFDLCSGEDCDCERYTPAGELYELKLLEHDFGLASQHSLGRDGDRYDELYAKPALTPKERKELETILNRMLGLVLNAPAKVKAVLTDAQKAAVVRSFTTAPYVMAARALAQQETPEEPEAEEPITEG